MAEYSLTASTNIVLRHSDNTFIPNDVNNADWQQYEIWLHAGNTPEPYVPPPPSPQQQYMNAIAAGLQATFTTSTDLNATYAIDSQTQANLTAETVCILTNGVFGTGSTSRLWPDINGVHRTMDIAQFRALATSISFYVNELYQVMAAIGAGQQTNWPLNEAVIDA